MCVLAYDDYGRGQNIIDSNLAYNVGGIGIQVTAGMHTLLPIISSPSHLSTPPLLYSTCLLHLVHFLF